MNTILLVITAFGSEGTATHRIVIEPPIKQIVWQVVVGGVNDVLQRQADFDAVKGRMAGILEGKGTPAVSLAIDGQPRTVTPRGSGVQRLSGHVRNAIAWGTAAYRIAGYAISDARPKVGDAGRIEYSYRLRVRNLDIRRTTRISDGRVSLLTDIYGRLGPKGELCHVRLDLLATEGSSGTTITGTATGYSEIGRRCRLVSRIAGRRIADAMRDELLRTIEVGGRAWYSAGGIAEVMR